MGVAAIFGIFAATSFWFPKMFGRMMNETLGKVHFWITLAGVYAIFMPMHFLGVSGALRRYAQLTEFNFLKPLQPVHLFITVAAFITIGAQSIFLANFFWSLWKGKESRTEPVGSDDAGMVDVLPAAA